MSKKLAIKGHSTHGKEVIELLKMMGGRDVGVLKGNHDYYVIDECENNLIKFYGYNYIHCHEFVVLTLEEFLEKYPCKVGDVIKFPNNMAEEIAEMKWDEELEDVIYTSVSGWTRPCHVPKNTKNKTNMKNMFIEFDNTLININHIIYIENLDGTYDNFGKFAVRCITDKNIKCEWYSVKKQRNERYEYLVNLLSIK